MTRGLPQAPEHGSIDPRLASVRQAIGTACLALPEAVETHPWGEYAYKVRKRSFVFLAVGNRLTLSIKLPQSHPFVLDEPFAVPMAYDMGRHGWVMLAFAPEDEVPLDRLTAWIAESYRAVAPKTLAMRVDDGGR